MTDPLVEKDDETIFRLIKEGNVRAFTVAYERYWRVIYGHVYKILRDESESKDIVQDVFSSLWTKGPTLTGQLNLGGYLFVCARNRVLNSIKKEKFKARYLNSDKIVVPEACEATMQYVEMRDMKAVIDREIAALPPRMQQVFRMSRYQNMTYKQIGEQLGTSDETIKKQIGAALKIMRHRLKDLRNPLILIILTSRFK